MFLQVTPTGRLSMQVSEEFTGTQTVKYLTGSGIDEKTGLPFYTFETVRYEVTFSRSFKGSGTMTDADPNTLTGLANMSQLVGDLLLSEGGSAAGPSTETVRKKIYRFSNVYFDCRNRDMDFASPTFGGIHLKSGPTRREPCDVASAPTGFGPNALCTPGSVSSRNVVRVCQQGYSEGERFVPSSTRSHVLRSYGLTKETARAPEWQLDHLVPISLGGSNGATNLWPQRDYGAKDRLEFAVWSWICGKNMAGLVRSNPSAAQLELLTAQNDFAIDWPSLEGVVASWKEQHKLGLI